MSKELKVKEIAKQYGVSAKEIIEELAGQGIETPQAENSVIPDSVKIGKNTAIAGVTTKEDYPDGELAAGQVIAAKDGGKE